jgi:hydrogenase/urease accessory protein HupE
MPLFARFAFAVGIEVAWEILENTPMVIEHYREQALAQGYVGDSILNSVSDTLMMVGGFILAWRLPAWASVALCILLEVFVMYMIRDGLALNIVGFVYTPEFIASWQSSAQ